MYFLKVKCDNTNDNRKNKDGILNQYGPSSLKKSVKDFQFFTNYTNTIRINTSKLCDKTI